MLAIPETTERETESNIEDDSNELETNDPVNKKKNRGWFSRPSEDIRRQR